MKSRNRRTVFLGALATGVFVWAAIDRFGVPADEMGRLMLYCVLGVLLSMVLAAAAVAVVLLIKTVIARISGPGASPREPPPE